MYTLYTIEVVWLSRIMKMPSLYHGITGKNLKIRQDIKLEVVQFVDDSNNCISANTLSNLVEYTQDYMRLLIHFYEANKLRLNPEKTCFMMNGNVYQNNRRMRVKIQLDDGIEIQDSLAVKVLGWWMSPDGKLTNHTNKIKGPVYHTLSKLKPVLKFMNLDQRREVVYAKASIAKYGLALYVGQTETVKDRLTTIFM